MPTRRNRSRPLLGAILLLTLALGGVAMWWATAQTLPAAAPRVLATPAGLEKIQHFIFIMQENRSFDSYFGTFPGADGIPMRGGVPTVCVPDPVTQACVRPFHDPRDANLPGGRNDALAAGRDIHSGLMDGFLRDNQRAGSAFPEAMGYHDAREIPNYWAYAKGFVLQ